MINKKTQEAIKENYALLKARNSKDLNSIKAISKKYEDLRLATSYFNEPTYQDISIKTGRALSNMCFDLMSSNEISTIDNFLDSTERSNSEFYFLAHRGGLCNRLRAISSLRVLCRKLDVPFSYSWYEIELCNGGPLPHLSKCSRLDFLIDNIQKRTSKIYLSDEPLTPWAYYSKLGMISGYNNWNSFLNDYVYESQILLNEIITTSSDNNSIQNKLNTLSNQAYLAIHIRRTDFVEYFNNHFPHETLPTTSDYIRWIKNNYRSGLIYISTDDLDVKLEIENEFPGRTFSLGNEYDIKKTRQTKFDHTLLDLVALSKGTYMLPTPRSSFSEYASSISSGETIKFWEKK